MLSNKNKLIIIFASVILFSIFPPFGRSPVGRYFLLSTSIEAAPLQLQVKFPCPDFPGAKCPATPELAAQSPAAYIARLYQFALMLSGMLAFGMIIFGAIQYTVSAGNTTQQSDAKDRITQALWGVALLLGAYLILYTIDPGLVNLRDPKIKNIELPLSDNPNPTRRYTQPEGIRCYPEAGLLCERGLACVKENDYYVCKKLKINTATEKPEENIDLTFTKGSKCPEGFKIERLKICTDKIGDYPKGPTPICCKRTK